MPPSVLATDAYKFSMAEAGWPLRRETFYYTHRKGGPQLVPFDAAQELARLVPEASAADYAWLAGHEYELGAGFKAGLRRAGELRVRALPEGAWFWPREPVFTVEGPSALVSWLEPLVLQLHVRIQVATLARTDRDALERALAVVPHAQVRDLALATLDRVGARAPRIAVDEGAYAAGVRARAAELVGIVGDPARLFEVGLRSAACLEQHLVALAACKDAGLSRTSHAFGARALGLTPVGTMGHEHVQRYGSDDAAFRAMRERRPERSSFLLDTFDTVRSGLPAALALIAERPGDRDSIRYDSGDKLAQYELAAARAHAAGLRPVHILEDSLDAGATRVFEAARARTGVAASEQFYGYGGYLVAHAPLTRDRVSAVYKLSQTGATPTMKLANEAGAGKQSVPGRPVVFRRRRGDGASGPIGVIGQEGEPPPDGYELLSGAGAPGSSPPIDAPGEVVLSPATRALVERLRRAYLKEDAA
jgi:nicotinate phosphoribosyltransferase